MSHLLYSSMMYVWVVRELVLNYFNAEETTQLRRKATWEKDHQPSPEPVPDAVARGTAVERRARGRLG